MKKPLLLSACLALLLAACSAGESPRQAEFVPPAPAQQDFGDLRVHFNALPTLSLSEAVAREYGVKREAGTALVVIALRRLAGSEESALEGSVEATARDLSGSRQAIAFHAARTGDYVDYIGTLRVGERDSYRFDVSVRVDGRTETLQFQRNF